MRKRLRTMLLVLTALLVVLCMAACDDSTGGGNNPPASPSSEYSIKITPVGSTTIQVSKTVTLRTTVVGTSQKDVTWTSLNENIATVSDKGVVKGVAAGEATIKATLNIDENCSATIKITVEPAVAPETVQIAGYPEDRTGWVGETTQLSVNVTPDNASDAVDWASSDTNVADVSETGVVTYKNKGTVTITATSQSDATKKSTVELNVRKGIYMTAAGSQSWDFSKQDDETFKSRQKIPNFPKVYRPRTLQATAEASSTSKPCLPIGNSPKTRGRGRDSDSAPVFLTTT